MHDILDLDRRGIPGGYVATTEFIEATNAQGAGLRYEPATHFLPHPIQDRTDDEMRELARDAFHDVLELVLDGGGN